MKDKERKELFDVYDKKQIVYFDNSACTFMPKSVCDVVDFHNRFESVNAGRGTYKLAYGVTQKVEKARERVAKFINASNNEIVFVKNTTEAINLVCLAYAKHNLAQGDEIVVSNVEHNSNFAPWLELAKQKNANLKFVQANEEGKVEKEQLEKLLTNKTKFVAINFASNTFGKVNDVYEIVKMIRKTNAKILIDASQIVAHKQIDVKKLDCDFLAFSGYKMFAPTGVGVLYAKEQLLKEANAVMFGGGMILDIENNEPEYCESPQKFEAGTLAISSIIGLGEACEFLKKITFEEVEKQEEDLKQYLFEEVSKINGVKVFNKNADLPILLFNIEGVHPHDAATFYDDEDVCVRAGNHCSHLIKDKIEDNSSLRASLNFVNNKQDIDKFVLVTKQIVKFFKG